MSAVRRFLACPVRAAADTTYAVSLWLDVFESMVSGAAYAADGPIVERVKP